MTNCPARTPAIAFDERRCRRWYVHGTRDEQHGRYGDDHRDFGCGSERDHHIAPADPHSVSTFSPRLSNALIIVSAVQADLAYAIRPEYMLVKGRAFSPLVNRC